MSLVRYSLLILLLIAVATACEKKQDADAPQTPLKTAEKAESAAAQKAEPAQKTLVPPAPQDPEAKKQWLRDVARRLEPTPKAFSVDAEGAGNWRACMPGSEIQGAAKIRLCPGTDINPNVHCFTPYQTQGVDSSPVELWVEDGRLVRVVIRSKFYKSPQGVGVGSYLADIHGNYNNIKYMRADGGQWVATIEPLNTHFYLLDNSAASPDQIDRFTKVEKLETSFVCPEQAAGAPAEGQNQPPAPAP